MAQLSDWRLAPADILTPADLKRMTKNNSGRPREDFVIKEVLPMGQGSGKHESRALRAELVRSGGARADAEGGGGVAGTPEEYGGAGWTRSRPTVPDGTRSPFYGGFAVTSWSARRNRHVPIVFWNGRAEEKNT